MFEMWKCLKSLKCWTVVFWKVESTWNSGHADVRCWKCSTSPKPGFKLWNIFKMLNPHLYNVETLTTFKISKSCFLEVEIAQHSENTDLKCLKCSTFPKQGFKKWNALNMLKPDVLNADLFKMFKMVKCCVLPKELEFTDKCGTCCTPPWLQCWNV